MRKPGCVEPVIFFRNHRDPAHPPGFVMLAPFSDYPTPEGYERCGAETLAEIDKLQAKLQDQEYLDRVGELADDEIRFQSARKKVYDDLYGKLSSSAISQYEKDFIRDYLKLHQEKREKYQKRFLCDSVAFLHAREMDLHGRRADDERWTGTADISPSALTPKGDA